MEKPSFLSRATGTLVNPLSKAMDSMRDVIEHHAGDTDGKQLLDDILQLFVVVLQADGQISSVERQAVSRLVRDVYGEAASNQLQKLLDEDKSPDLHEVCSRLSKLTDEERETLLRALFTAAFSDNQFGREEQECLVRIAEELGIPDEAFKREEAAALEQHNGRMKLVRSSTGLIASVVVIGVFILAATFLKSVLFGLILAYFFLPLQQRYQRSFLESGFLARLFGLANLVCVKPFAFIIQKVRGVFRRKKEPEPKPATEVELTQSAISKACNATVLTVALALLLVALGLVILTLNGIAKGMGDYNSTDHKTAQKHLLVLAEKVAGWPLIGDGASKLAEELKEDDEALEKIFEGYVRKASEDEEAKRSLWDGATKALGMAIGFLGAVGSFFLNTLMSVFFFSFFLGKMAVFRHKHGGDIKEGDYLVQSLFQTSWLPTTSEETLKSAADVINEVLYKLKTWVRGYMWIIIIETSIYIVVFFLLGVPYAILLGAIAGLTVLLPFLGPLISLAITIIVCLVTGNADLTLCLSLVGLYFVMNSIIEQLFLYPAFVGEALGLNVLETLIVVLLGGLFAGLAGMIFAVPVASVLKFLIPRLYQSFFQADELVMPKSDVATPTGEV